MKRTCTKCKRELPISSFSKDRYRKDGLKPWCKSCANASMKAWRTRNREAFNKASRDYYWENREVRLAYCRLARQKHKTRRKEYEAQYAARNKKARRAKTLVADAIRRGEIQRPKRCELCSKADRLHGHHEDYDKPLDVIWLCPSCHNRLHNGHVELPEKLRREYEATISE